MDTGGIPGTGRGSMKQPIEYERCLRDYRMWNHTTLTVDQERAVFCEWCEYLAWLRDEGALSQKEYHAERDDLERWYAWIGNARDAAYMSRVGLVQLELFEAQS